MKMVLQSLALTLFFTSQVGAQNLPACPGGDSDPSKFCPVGQQWSEAAQDCVVMA